MPSPGLKTAKPQEQKQLELTGILKGWCSANGVALVRMAGGEFRVKDGLFTSRTIGSGYANCNPLTGLREITSSFNDPQTILHEGSHMFLMLRKNFYTESYYSREKLAQAMRTAGERGAQDLQKTMGTSSHAEKTWPDALAKNLALNSTLYKISQMENLFSSSIVPFFRESGGDLPVFFKRLSDKLKSALGEPQDYPQKMGNGCGLGIKDRSAGLSWVGNIVDESSTLKIPLDELGHPMSNFHEFFASLSTTLCFDGKEMFSSLENFRQLALQEPVFAPLFKELCSLLRECVPLAKEWRGELAVMPGAEGNKDLANFGLNIAKLDGWLRKNGF